MKKINFDQKLQEEIKNFETKQIRPSLLLHACCGPCSSYVMEYIAKYFNITILYYNPNIFPPEEYYRRLNELKSLLPKYPPALENNIKLVEDVYDPNDFYNYLNIKNERDLEEEKEKGERCRRCYKLRLERSYKYALENEFDYFCTTLSISPFKDAEKINTIGEELEKAEIQKKSYKKVTKWLYSDFKKNGGFLRSLELSKEYNLYRQQYCGCVFSKKNTEKEKKEREMNKNVTTN